MTIQEYIQTQVFAPRLGKDENNHILVVYDPDQRYRQICLDMASESRQVVDASESSIISRAQGASLRRSSTERSSLRSTQCLRQRVTVSRLHSRSCDVF